MKIKNYVLLLLLVIVPLNVKANIMCNDGPESPTCSDCHRDAHGTEAVELILTTIIAKTIIMNTTKKMKRLKIVI